LRRLGIFHLPKLKIITIGNLPVKPPQRNDLNQLASLIPGAIQIEGLIFKKEGAKLLDSDTLLKTDARLTFDTDTEQLPKQVHALLNPCDLNRSRSYRVHTPTKIGLSFAPNSSYDPSDCGRPETIPWSEIQPYLSDTGLRVMRDFIR
jgi:hypothetical protein